MKDADEWREYYRRLWEESLARLEEYLRELQEKENSNGHKK